jgi:very-short-patch-repair endonuclease
MLVLDAQPAAARPTVAAMDALSALRQCGGAGRWKRLMAAGVTDGHLRAAVRSGAVVRRGPVYALPDAAADVLVAAQLSGRLTCLSAAQHLGLDVLQAPTLAHVAVPKGSPRASKGAVVHRTGGGPGWCVDLDHALLDCLRCRPPVEALVMIDSALRLQQVNVEHLCRQLQGPGSVRQRGTLRLADPQSGSCIETVARVAFVAAGFTVRCQVFISDVGRVDLLIDGWLVVEIDGYGYHSSREQFRNDRRRANMLAEKGFVLLRFSFEDVMSRIDHVVRQVAIVLAPR